MSESAKDSRHYRITGDEGLRTQAGRFRRTREFQVKPPQRARRLLTFQAEQGIRLQGGNHVFQIVQQGQEGGMVTVAMVAIGL